MNKYPLLDDHILQALRALESRELTIVQGSNWPGAAASRETHYPHPRSGDLHE